MKEMAAVRGKEGALSNCRRWWRIRRTVEHPIYWQLPQQNHRIIPMVTQKHLLLIMLIMPSH